jgi:hypothetical protein
MKQINKHELFQNLAEFLKSKGVDLKDGSYTKGIHAGCSFLADAINLSQAGLTRARVEIEKQLDQARQVIHEKTAPRKPAAPSSGHSAKKKGKGRNSGPNSRPSPAKKPAKRKAV